MSRCRAAMSEGTTQLLLRELRKALRAQPRVVAASHCLDSRVSHWVCGIYQ